MECVPRCKTCTGLCATGAEALTARDKSGSRSLINPAGNPVGPGTVTLVCGHYTNERAQSVLREYRPKRGLRWCATCNKWVKYVPVVKPRKTKDVPPEQPPLSLKESILGGPALNLIDEMEVIPF